MNDSFDHSYGDSLLREVALRLREVVREIDTIARMGGDEFTVILNDIRGHDNAGQVARKILGIFDFPFEIRNHKLYLGASIGISLCPDNGTSVEDLVRNADTAMYQAKESCRKTFCHYEEALTTKAVARVSMDPALHHALESGELLVH